MSQPTTGRTAPLIPRDVLFGNPERTNPQLSPDGKYLSYVAPDENGVQQVWLRTVGQEDDRILTADKKRGIRMYFWTFDGEQLIYMQDADGDENWHLFATNLRTGTVRDLTPFQGVQAHMLALDPRFPHEALVGLNLEDRRRHDVYRVNLANGAVELDTRNPGSVVGWTADARMQVLAATESTPQGGWVLTARDSVETPWRTVREWGPGDEGGAVVFSLDGETLYITGTHDANAKRLIAFTIATGQETVVAEDSHYDLGGFFIHPLSHAIQAVGFYRDRLEWQVLDESIAKDFAAFAAIAPGQFSASSRDLEDRNWLITSITDDGPVYYSLYERGTGKITRLFSNQPKLEGLPLVPMTPITYTARDGLTIHGYLATPGDVPANKLPTVLLVHGGPWGRDVWGYNPTVQWLANRGYAVLMVNFRGSSGYGKEFLNAGNREWAGKMHDDLVDAVRWIVKQGVADPEKVAIMGGSYGGYAALVGLTFTPELFAAGVDIVGPSNLITLMRSVPPYWEPILGIFRHRVGNVDTEEEFLKSRSPLFLADRIQRPLLIGQGANDPRVKQAESEQIVEVMRKASLPVQYVLYTDEGHGFARPENRLHFFAIAEEFLAKHLGGRCEPAGEIPGHSGIVS